MMINKYFDYCVLSNKTELSSSLLLLDNNSFFDFFVLEAAAFHPLGPGCGSGF